MLTEEPTEETQNDNAGTRSPSTDLLCFFVAYETDKKKSWRILETKYNLNNAHELQEWIENYEKIIGSEMCLINWKQLET